MLSHHNNTNQQPSPFVQIKQAILNKETDQAIKLIKTFPNALLLIDKEKNTLWHFAAKHCHNKKIIFCIMDQLSKMQKLDVIAKLQNAQGKTPLHLETMYSNSKVIRETLKKLGPQSNGIVRSCDFNRELPITDLTKHRHDSKVEKYKIFRLLENHSLFNTAIKLSEQIQPKINETDPRIKRNLEIAYDVINKVRAIIQSSYTHPQMNEASYKENKRLIDKIENLRGKTEHYKLKKSSDFNNYIKELKKEKIGNCGEMANMALYILRKYHPEIRTEVGHIENGDHVFAVIDIDPNFYNRKGSSSWGKYAVICDAWSGKAYPIKNIFTELEDYKRLHTHNKYYNLLIKFNPGYHQLGTRTRPPQYIPPAKRKPEEIKQQPFFKKPKLTATPSTPPVNEASQGYCSIM